MQAIPFIVNEFQSYADIGWYGAAYLLTAGSFQPLYGRVFMLFDLKWSYLCSLAIFEVDSLLCGVAPNSSALIAGRAIQGLGSAGILTGSFVICSHAVPLAKRPVLTAVVGLM
jgi:MFS family permease